MRTLGAWLLIGGAIVALFALFGFDTTVSGGLGNGRVHNIGLLQDRQNLLIASCAAAVVGVLLLISGRNTNSNPQVRPGGAGIGMPLRAAVSGDFHGAINRGEIGIIEELLDSHKVHADGELDTGRGYLQYAVLSRDKPLIKLLLKHRASVERRDTLGNTAAELANVSIDLEVSQIIACHRPAEAKASSTAAVPSSLLIADEIVKLAALRDQGLLTPEEYAKQKARLLQ